MSKEIACELVGGPYDKQVGWLTIVDRPQAALVFSLGDRDSMTGTNLIVPGHSGTDDKLAAYYLLVDEKPRKITMVVDVDGHPRAQSHKGVRYRYDPKSPCEELFEQARRDVLLTAEAHESVMATRRLLLDGGGTKEGST